MINHQISYDVYLVNLGIKSDEALSSSDSQKIPPIKRPLAMHGAVLVYSRVMMTSDIFFQAK